MRGVTLLWALRSPCHLQCRYCYFGMIEAGNTPLAAGALSHAGQRDLSRSAMLDFIATITPSLVHRVFVAGGEPLIWPGTWQILSALKNAGCEVIVCTNGLPLAQERVSSALLDLAVDAVSISLDSCDATYHDHWRVDRSGQGWKGVVQGIRTLVGLRNQRHASTRVGVYTVMTQQNITHLARTARFVAALGVDYYIIQPVSLAPEHRFHNELTLDVRHRADVTASFNALRAAHVPLYLPPASYTDRILQTLTDQPLPIIKQCFGGRDLFFVEPDGSLWDCPSMYKIAQTPPEARLSLVNQDADTLFSLVRRQRITDCTCFSQDCVNMWMLMSFDEIVYRQKEALHDASA